MKRITLTAGTMLAVTTFGATPTVEPLHLDAAAATQPRLGCTKRFTVRMDERAARVIYARTKRVTRHERQLLSRLVRCQRNPQARWFVRWYNTRERRAHWLREHPPAPPPANVLASWYDDAGATACGFHATYGVANKTLPCGSRVTLRHGAATITAIIEDRGPFIAGRDFDLNPSTKAALGCSDLCYIWASATG